MTQRIFFIQGAGEGAHDEDAKLVESLRRMLGSDYEISYPVMPEDWGAGYREWSECIKRELAGIGEPVIVVGHSVGGSMILKYLSDNKVKNHVAGIFLMAVPFWGGDGWRYEGYEQLELPDNLAVSVLEDTPVFLFHCEDDDSVPFEHLALYKKLLPRATVRELEHGGHQFGDGLAFVAQDIIGTGKTK